MVFYFEYNARKEKLNNYQKFASTIDRRFEIELVINEGGSTIDKIINLRTIIIVG